MRLWIDADALPGDIKDIIIRAADRLKLEAVFVANKAIHLPRTGRLRSVQVSRGADVADDYIVTESEAGDLAVTADIPLAALLLPKGVLALNPRGELYTEDNIRERLSLRDFMQGLRDSGTITGGPRPFDEKAKRQFAAALDRALTQLTRL